jgi:hypothetical protein
MIFPESSSPIASQGFQGLFKNLGLSTNPQLTEQYSRISMPRISNLANLCPQVLQIIGGNFRSKALFLQAIEHQWVNVSIPCPHSPQVFMAYSL